MKWQLTSHLVSKHLDFEGEVEKDFFGNQLTPFKQITRKPLVPSDAENIENSRARSAKLRIAEKK